MFLDNVLIAAKQVAILYIIVAVGAVSSKVKIFPEDTATKCTNLLFYVVTPAKIIESFLVLDYSTEKIKSFFIAMGCGMLLHIFAAVFSRFTFNKSGDDQKCIYKYASTYGNCGYMALPLANAVLGAEGVSYCSAVIVSFQIFSFTHGIYTMNIGNTKEKVEINFKRIILNPGVVAVLIGLPLFLLPFDLPDIVTTPITYVGSLNTPLAMLIFGTYIAGTGFKSIFRDWRLWSVGLIKLIILPLVMLGAFKLMGLSGALLTSLILSAGAPPANNTVMFAAKYDRNKGLASQVVATVSFVSILTMPLMIGLASVA